MGAVEHQCIRMILEEERMDMALNIERMMPGVANEAGPPASGSLQWVGMDEIVMPLRLAGVDDDHAVPARIRAAVNLTRPEVRGIHMSRLYLRR
ncbi:GTP cyclohydrolase, FolE2/MptA family [Mycolicibacterium neoaurum]|uniref:GTP cyclohydrolase, FolE2/MptA family n=1 Tax=Mycolicibacterium neoaurum TaxID=1795 RepID=UPI0026729998|nr:GTP cyclohydrolase, FolE2/MptA family [Mycolicibacterium neoaurum]MDO3399902.1 GTP cyclohydrolase, FolE2/MptA family [Mycolicibacterium neoaurum]